MKKQIGGTITLTSGMKPTLEDLREDDHHKKVTDKDRAIRNRRKAFGHDSVGTPVDQPDPKHLVRGKVLGGQEKEVDRQEFIKAMAKDPRTVAMCKKIIKKQKK